MMNTTKKDERSIGGSSGFTKEDCKIAVMNCTIEIGKSPSVVEYNEWRKKSSGVTPSKTTIVKNYGTWNDMKRALSLDFTVDKRERLPAVKMMTDDETNPVSGYQFIQHHDGEKVQQVKFSRLLATLLVDDISELKGNHVHHRDHTPWMDYIDNLAVLSPADHISYHNRARAKGFHDFSLA